MIIFKGSSPRGVRS